MKGWSVVEMKEWSQDPPLPSSHLRVDSGGKGILLEILAYLKPSEGKQFLSFVYVCNSSIWAYLLLLQPKTLVLCHHCCIFHHLTALRMESVMKVNSGRWISGLKIKTEGLTMECHNARGTIGGIEDLQIRQYLLDNHWEWIGWWFGERIDV